MARCDNEVHAYLRKLQKRVCDRMSKSNAEGHCVFDEDKIPDDDRIAINCENLKDVQIMDRMHAFSSSEVIDDSESENVQISCEVDEACSFLGANDRDSSLSDDGNNNVCEDDEQNIDYSLWCNICFFRCLGVLLLEFVN